MTTIRRTFASSALLGVGIALLAPILASGAYADPSPSAPSPSAPSVLAGPHAETGLSVTIAGHGSMGTYTYAIDTVTGDAPIAYCIDIDTQYRPGAQLVEQTWDEADQLITAGPQLLWVLRHSYPNRSLEQTATESAAAYHDGLSVEEAIAATQAALWFYADGVAMTSTSGTAHQQADVQALYAYLTGPANVGLEESPPASLSLSEPQVGTPVDGRVGPIEVSTSLSSVLLKVDAAEPMQLVDEDGAPVSTAADGDQVYLQISDPSSAGFATITADGIAVVESGRIFGPADPSPARTTQSLILATTAQESLMAYAQVAWDATPPPPTTPSPPITTPPTTTTISPTPTTSTPRVSASTPLADEPPTTAAPTTSAPPAELADTGTRAPQLGVLAAGLCGAGGLALICGARRR